VHNWLIVMVSSIDQTGLRGKIRDKPIAQELELVLRRAADSAGVDTVFITSGGQPGTSGKRTGSTRHDGGRAADLQLIKDGRPLTFTDETADPIIEAFVTSAAANGAIGIGAGVEYMGPRTLHVGFGRSLQDLTKVVWGAGKTSANAPPWLRAAAEKGWKNAVETPMSNAGNRGFPISTNRHRSRMKQRLSRQTPCDSTVGDSRQVDLGSSFEPERLIGGQMK
jgi:hypothetical protein